MDLELELRYYHLWLALALVLHCLPPFGLADGSCLLEILVESSSKINAHFEPATLTLIPCLV